MPNDVLQFVDSISATATLRLDLNDGVKWETDYEGFDFSPPPLRRAINGTLLTDGSVVSASSYDNRVLIMQLMLIDASADAVATQTQLLSRELDRDGNFLKWQQNTATSPVFFRTLRSTATRITEIPGNGTFKTFEVAVLAEPFALGLREDVAVGTVNNDPAAGSNGLFFDITGVKGDVAAPIVIKDANGMKPFGILACRQHGTPANLIWVGQCESMTLGTDTTNPGGGPDAAMSGAGVNNFVRCSFATDATFGSTRISWIMTSTLAQQLEMRGMFRLFACVRRSDNTSTIQIQPSVLSGIGAITGTAVTVPLSTSRQLVEIGLFALDGGSSVIPGRYGAEAPASTCQVQFSIARTSGAGTIDLDFLMLVPADEQLLLWDTGLITTHGGDGIIDAGTETICYDDVAGSSIFTGAVGVSPSNTPISGGYPTVKPGVTNRFLYVVGLSKSRNGLIAHDKTVTSSLTVSYWPRYLYARPATT